MASAPGSGRERSMFAAKICRCPPALHDSSHPNDERSWHASLELAAIIPPSGLALCNPGLGALGYSQWSAGRRRKRLQADLQRTESRRLGRQPQVLDVSKTARSPGKPPKRNPTTGNTFLHLAARHSSTTSWSAAQLQDRSAATRAFSIAATSPTNGSSAAIRPTSTAAMVGPASLYEERGRGVLANRGQKVTIAADGKKDEVQVADAKELQATIKKGDWNDYEITAQGNHLIHKINGRVTADVIDNQADRRAMTGILALQVHAGRANEGAIQEHPAQAARSWPMAARKSSWSPARQATVPATTSSTPARCC